MPLHYLSQTFGGPSGTFKSSLTISAPVPSGVRQAVDGSHPFIVKRVHFKVCAAPSLKQKMYFRVSAGGRYDDSLISTISWQKAPTVVYMFQGINFHHRDSDGGLTLYLVAGGPSIAGGSGSYDYVQVASEPTGLRAVRSATDPNKVTVSWTKQGDDGGSSSLMGYRLQAAQDAGFTKGLRDIYISKETIDVFGLYFGYDWFFRVAARNEVSEYYKLPGGVWSTTANLPKSAPTSSTGGDPGPAPGGGSPDPGSGSGGSTGGGSTGGGNTHGGGGSTGGSDNPGGSTGGTSGGTSGGTTGGGSSGGGSGGSSGGTGGGTGGTGGSGGSSGGGTGGTGGGTGGSGGGSGSGPGSGGTGVTTVPIGLFSSTETEFGGLLLSSGSPEIAPHTVYLADKGGRVRLGQFTELTSLQWDRRVDDISQARFTLADAAVEANREVLDRIAVGRHEIVIYRGDERVWEGPITLDQRTQKTVVIEAKDPMWYTNRTVMHNGYSNAYPNLAFVVERVAEILFAELARKESLDPPINVLPYVHTYVEAGDARTTRVTLPYTLMLWDHIDDLAATAGMDYTTVGRAMHFWDSTRAALGRTRDVTNDDFAGQATITDYGVETATVAISADNNGNFGIAGGIDPFYGEIEFFAPAYGETGNSVADPNSPDAGQTVSQTELNAQARRNLHGRNPTPRAVAIPANSSFRVRPGGLGFDVLVPGVHMPLRVSVGGRSYAHIQKLLQVTVSVNLNGAGESIQLSLAPTNDADFLDEGLIVTDDGSAV